MGHGSRRLRRLAPDPDETLETLSDLAASLARRVTAASRKTGALRTLLLDVDGTLAPIAPTPGQAHVPEATLQSLRRLLLLRWRIAVVSGRPARQVRKMIPIRGIRVFGGHGHEGSWDGSPRRSIAPDTIARLDAIAKGGRELALATWGVLVEVKPTGVAFHDRSVPAERLVAWRRDRDRWLATVDLEDLVRLDGRRVVEFRPAGVDKGVVVRELPRESRGPHPDESLVAIGDDRTDEDMFRELAGLGLGVRVGRPGRRTLASYRLPSSAAVGRFLALLAVS